jgi:uncharacterized protein YbjT (DUF2867 family)
VTRRILVTGGTGTLGAAVLDRLLQATQATQATPFGGRDEIVVASRRPRPTQSTPYTWMTVDYAAGADLDAAAEGVTAIIHCVNDQRHVDADRAVVAAARRAGAHLVYISIVGIDQVRLGYYRRKLAGEALVQSSGVPWTILRTTQFHDLAAMVCRQLARLPIAFAPSIPLQPIDVREVAGRLVELAGGAPAGRVSDMGGPQVRRFGDLMHAYLDANGLRRPVAPLRLPGKAFHAFRNGYHLTPDHAVGEITFEEYLAEKRLS